MPKPHTFPTLYNEALQIHVSTLKEGGYLLPKQLKSGTITWSCNRQKKASISITVNSISKEPYLELDYISNNEPRRYKAGLVTVASNLGIGRIWYFVCPVTKKRCRKLYFVGGYFLHREAFKRCMYKVQTQSKRHRTWKKMFEAYYSIDMLYGQLYKKHFKKAYAGKSTKKYLRIMELIHKAEAIPHHEIEKLLIR